MQWLPVGWWGFALQVWTFYCFQLIVEQIENNYTFLLDCWLNCFFWENEFNITLPSHYLHITTVYEHELSRTHSVSQTQYLLIYCWTKLSSATLCKRCVHQVIIVAHRTSQQHSLLQPNYYIHVLSLWSNN